MVTWKVNIKKVPLKIAGDNAIYYVIIIQGKIRIMIRLDKRITLSIHIFPLSQLYPHIIKKVILEKES
jgi:hypothetical protein